MLFRSLRGRQPCLVGSNTSSPSRGAALGPDVPLLRPSVLPQPRRRPRPAAAAAGLPRGSPPWRRPADPAACPGGGAAAGLSGRARGGARRRKRRRWGVVPPPALGAFGAALFCCGRRLRPVASPNYPPALPSRWEGRGREAYGHRCGGDGSLRRQSRRCAVKTAQKYAEAARLCAHVLLFLFGLRSAAGLPPLAAATKPAVPRYRPLRHLPVSVPAALPPSRRLFRPPARRVGLPAPVSASRRLYRPPTAQSNSPDATKRVFILLRSKKP